MVARPGSGPWLAAVRSWDAVARDLLAASVEWQVHSVFGRACNLVSVDGELLGIVQAPAWNGPATVVLAPGSLPEPLTRILRPGEPAHHEGDRVLIGGRLDLDLSASHLWARSPIVRTLDGAEVAARLDRVAAIVATEAPQDGLALLLHNPAASPLLRRARAALDGLVAAIRAQDWQAVSEPTRQLSGLGPGLTPSGDDLLAGLALGFSAMRGALPSGLAAALLAAVDGRTTDLAVARVKHAVDGHPDEAVHRLLGVLAQPGVGRSKEAPPPAPPHCGGEGRRCKPLPSPLQWGGAGGGASSWDDPSASLDAAVRAVLNYGHSSGADTLVGLIVGVQLGLDDERQAPTPVSPGARPG